MIYQILNKLNGHSYIGKTKKTIQERYDKHLYNCKYGIKTHLYRAMRKYGIHNFVVKKIENSFREEYWIKKLKPEYNMTAGGDGGATHHNKSFKDAMKRYHAKKPYHEYATYGMLGKKMSHKQRQTLEKKVYSKMRKAVSIRGKIYSSYTEAQKHNPGISIRRRVASHSYPDYFVV